MSGCNANAIGCWNEGESALAQSFTVSPHVSSHLSLVCWFLFVVAVLCLGVLFVCCFFVCFPSATLL